MTANIENDLKYLLMLEYLQRDVYETYAYYIIGLSSISIQKELEDHMKEEMEHIDTLQRYMAYLGIAPMTDRIGIPQIEDVSLRGILEYDLKLENEAVKNYSNFIAKIENVPELTSLRVDIENILIQEQEHVHDLAQWLRETNP